MNFQLLSGILSKAKFSLMTPKASDDDGVKNEIQTLELIVIENGFGTKISDGLMSKQIN